MWPFLFRHKAPFFWTLFASSGALFSVYGAQWWMGLNPCILCHYQRMILFGIVGFALFAYLGFSNKSLRRMGLFILIIGFLGNGGLASYQVMVEQKILPPPKACKVQKAKTIEDLKAQLSSPVVPCDKVPWSFMGISLAGYGGLFYLIMAWYLWLSIRHDQRRRYF